MGIKQLLNSQNGQMAVELAVFMPVVLALAIASIDLLVYMGDCVRFDRLVGHIVQMHAASPDAEGYSAGASVGAIQADLTEAMGDSGRLSVRVSVDDAAGGTESDAGASSGTAASGVTIGSFVPGPRVYTCSLDYMPWPFEHGAFGIEVSPIAHSRRFAIDPYRPGALL